MKQVFGMVTLAALAVLFPAPVFAEPPETTVDLFDRALHPTAPKALSSSSGTWGSKRQGDSATASKHSSA